MGMDFRVLILPAFEMNDFRRNAIRKAAREMEEWAIDEIVAACGTALDLDEEDAIATKRDKIASQIVSECESLWRCAFRRRDCNCFRNGDYYCLVTGGMTMGDPPTDSWEGLETLKWAVDGDRSLYAVLAGFAREDFQRFASQEELRDLAKETHAILETLSRRAKTNLFRDLWMKMGVTTQKMADLFFRKPVDKHPLEVN